MATYRGTYGNQIDSKTAAFQTIPHAQKEVHDGNAFASGHRVDSLANNTTAYYCIESGDREAHITGLITVGGDCHLDIYAFSDCTGGTLVYGARKNGNTPQTPTMQIFYNPTINTIGVDIFQDFIPGGQRSQASGGTSSSQEWDLVPNSQYILAITNVSGLPTTVALTVDWIEHAALTDAYEAIPYSYKN